VRGIELDSRSRAVFTIQRQHGSNAIIAHNCSRGGLRLDDGRAVDGLKRDGAFRFVRFARLDQ
jgi:hypothetical protein